MISGTLKLVAFSGNTIKANGTLLPPPPGYSYTGYKPHFGLYLVNVKADLASNVDKRKKIKGFR